MSTINYDEWNVLGYFHYHDVVIALKSSLDERDYVFLKKVRENKNIPVHFNNLSEARDRFTKEIDSILYYTSGSSLSLYMQQRAKPKSSEL